MLDSEQQKQDLLSQSLEYCMLYITLVKERKEGKK